MYRVLQELLPPILKLMQRQYLSKLRSLNKDMYRGADKSLALPGRKQPRKHVRDAQNFNKIETRALIKFFFFLQGAEGNSRHSDRNISLFPSWPG